MREQRGSHGLEGLAAAHRAAAQTTDAKYGDSRADAPCGRCYHRSFDTEGLVAAHRAAAQTTDAKYGDSCADRPQRMTDIGGETTTPPMSVIGHWSKIGEKAPQTLSYQWIQPTKKSIDKIPIVC